MSRRMSAVLVGLSLLVALYVAIGGLLGQAASEGAYQQFAVFSEVLTRIRSDYVEDPNVDRVITGALHGLLGSLDPYSSYLTPQTVEEYRARQEGPTGDVGLVLTKDFRRSGLISVVATLPASPAARAGLRTGDFFESIAGFSSREMSVEQARILLGGQPGTTVKLVVVRQRRSEPMEIELVRAQGSPLPAVWGLLEPGIGYIKVAAFTTGQTSEIRSAVGRLQAAGASKLLLDLRDCASGRVEEAVATAELFLEKGLIAYAEGQKYPRQEFSAEPAKTIWRGPLSVLINMGTAGPAEIVAAAVLENQRGDVVGERSYGVGSLQKLIPLDDGAALLLSVAKYYSPSGRAIQDEAVTPNVEVEPTEEDLERNQSLPHTLPGADDRVVGKAVERLRGSAARAPA